MEVLSLQRIAFPVIKKSHPNIVTDWEISVHSQNEVECISCHGDGHTTAEDFADVDIPTAETCNTCHEDQFNQFKTGKHAVAWAAMNAMPTAHMAAYGLNGWHERVRRMSQDWIENRRRHQ